MDDENEMRSNDGSMVEEQNEGMGIDTTSAEEDSSQQVAEGESDPYSVKKRLGMQAKKHQREMRALKEQIANLQAHVTSPNFQEHPTNPYTSPGQPTPPGNAEEERIQRAVRYAFEAKDAEERRAKEAESAAHVHKQYQRLHDEFDRASDKYQDFDETVRGDEVPFTTAIRDALLLVDNPADVAYKLGKNRQELSRISQLHPIEQAREVNKLSFGLMGGNSGRAPNSARTTPMNPIRSNPANNSSANKNAASIRAQMKAGTWK